MPMRSEYRRRGLGWHENYHDARDWDFDRLQLSTSQPLDEVDLRYLVSQVLDQGRTSSCVANALAHAIDILETKAGKDYIALSRFFLYFNSRKRSSSDISDSGTFIKDCLWGMSKAGAPNEELWPFNKWKINKRPPWEAYMKAYGRKDAKYYHIFSTGEQLILELKVALSDGYPVIFGTGIGEKFYDYQPGQILDIPKTSLGGHAMVIVGYFFHPVYGLIFIVLNSWGPNWGDAGFCLFSENYMRWLRTRDFTIAKEWAWLTNQ